VLDGKPDKFHHSGIQWNPFTEVEEKYRPNGVLTVSELKKRLSNVTLKGDQNPADLFEELAAIEHEYSETAAALGNQDLIGAVFAAAPEKTRAVLNIASEIKEIILLLMTLKILCTTFGVKEEENPVQITRKIYRHLIFL
jgi:hypothetical protein